MARSLAMLSESAVGTGTDCDQEYEHGTQAALAAYRDCYQIPVL
jgi:hypothetical protein